MFYYKIYKVLQYRKVEIQVISSLGLSKSETYLPDLHDLLDGTPNFYVNYFCSHMKDAALFWYYPICENYAAIFGRRLTQINADLYLQTSR